MYEWVIKATKYELYLDACLKEIFKYLGCQNWRQIDSLSLGSV